MDMYDIIQLPTNTDSEIRVNRTWPLTDVTVPPSEVQKTCTVVVKLKTKHTFSKTSNVKQTQLQVTSMDKCAYW